MKAAEIKKYPLLTRLTDQEIDLLNEEIKPQTVETGPSKEELEEQERKEKIHQAGLTAFLNGNYSLALSYYNIVQDSYMISRCREHLQRIEEEQKIQRKNQENQNRYEAAAAAFAKEEYEAAADIYKALGSYKDSKAKYEESQRKLQEKKEAEKLASYEATYQQGLELYKKKQYKEAAEKFDLLLDWGDESLYKDSDTYYKKAKKKAENKELFWGRLAAVFFLAVTYLGIPFGMHFYMGQRGILPGSLSSLTTMWYFHGALRTIVSVLGILLINAIGSFLIVLIIFGPLDAFWFPKLSWEKQKKYEAACMIAGYFVLVVGAMIGSYLGWILIMNLIG